MIILARFKRRGDMANGSSVVEEGLLELCLTRRVAAPAEVVFRAWIEPKHLAEWWGPKGFTNPVCEVDARVGGVIRVDMRTPNGLVHPMVGRFVEIDRPHRLVFWACPLDETGRPILEVLNSVTFTEVRGGTEIALVATVTKMTPAGEKPVGGMSQGWSESLDRLAELVLKM
jgi:uncharacterized protein YndB with AHSA1/START domain